MLKHSRGACTAEVARGASASHSSFQGARRGWRDSSPRRTVDVTNASGRPRALSRHGLGVRVASSNKIGVTDRLRRTSDPVPCQRRSGDRERIDGRK